MPHVWLDAYHEDEVTGSQLYQQINAQAFEAEIWHQLGNPRQLAQRLGNGFNLT